MKKPLPALVLALALAPRPASAAPDPALAPLAFLAGHCWIGTMPGTADTDEHCFAWIYDGRYLRDRHVVRRGEKVVYEGETTYYWNSVAKQVELLLFLSSRLWYFYRIGNLFCRLKT